MTKYYRPSSLRNFELKKEENTILEELPVDYFLFDSYVEGVYGGSGKMVDYSYVPKVNKPWFLAGGLSPDNIATVLSKVTPYSVDVSSGVEAQGMKSFDKMKCFIEMVRREETLV